MVMGHVMQKPMVHIPKVDLQTLREIQQENRDTIHLENGMNMTVIEEESSSVMEQENSIDYSTTDDVTITNENDGTDDAQRSFAASVVNHNARRILQLQNAPRVQLKRLQRKKDEDANLVKSILGELHNGRVSKLLDIIHVVRIFK